MEENKGTELKSVSLLCGGCGKRYSVQYDPRTPSDQMVMAICGCGVQTRVLIPKGEDGDRVMAIMNELMAKIPPILQQFRDAKMDSAEGGVMKAVAAAATEMAHDILHSDDDLREALNDWVLACLKDMFQNPRPGPTQVE